MSLGIIKNNYDYLIEREERNMDLDDEELQATREMNKTAWNNKVEKLKISVPLYTNQELSEMENIIQNDFESIFDKVSKHVYHDRELIALQKIIKKQQKELNKEKRKNKYIIDKIERIIDKIYNKYEDISEVKNDLEELLEERNDK